MKSFDVHYKINRINTIVTDSAYYARLEQEKILLAEGYKRDDFEIVLVKENTKNENVARQS